MITPEAARVTLHEKHQWLKNFFRHRQHPIKIINYTSKNLWLLLIPLAKYLIATRFDFQSWIKTNWLDILAIMGIFVFALLRWAFVYFEPEEDGLVAHSGLFGMFTTKVYYNEITTFSCCQSYIQRAVNACTMYIETNAKAVSDTDVKLVLSEKNVNEIFEAVTAQCKNKPKMTVKPKNKYLLAFSVLFSSTLTGVIIFASFMFEIYQLVGKELERELIQRVNGEITRVNTELFRFTSHIPKIIQIIVFVTLGGWFVSFVANLMRHWSFKATRCGSQIIVESGIITKRKHVINRSKINFLDYEKSLLMKLFKICSVTVFCTGYGVRHREISALIPITTSKEVRKSLKILVPDVPHSEIEIKTGVRDIPRFLYLPVALSFIPPAAGYVVKFFVDKWHYEINIITMIAVIPFAWKIIVSIAAAFNTSLGFKNGYCTLRYCRLYRFHKIIMPKKNISKAVVYQTWFQKISGRCNLRIYTNSQNTRVHMLRNLPLDETRELCLREGIKIYL
ncbi:MAG: PH domain-containing protein [Oscillospiraceae bacterium]